MNNIKAICIDNKNKPVEVPMTHWINEGTTYTINRIFNMVHPEHGDEPILGVTLKEVQIEKLNLEHKAYKLNRFGFTKEEFDKLLEYFKTVKEMEEFDPLKLLEKQTELIEV